MKLRMIGLCLALGLLLAGCGAEETSQKFTDMVIQQGEEAAAEQGTAETPVSGEDVQSEQSELPEQTEQEVPSEQETETQPEQEQPAEPDTPAGGDGEEQEAPEESAPTVDSSDLEHQLTVIYENRADWYTADLEMGSYTVADLDQNGKLEVLASVCMGSGLYTYTDIWEVDGDGLTKCTRLVDEYDSQVDMIVSDTVAYAVDGRWVYIFYDTVRMGAMGYNCDLRGMTMDGGMITEQTYATLSETYDGESSVLEAATAEGAPLTEDEFYALKENLLPGEKRQVTFRWINVYDGEFDLNTAPADAAIAMLGGMYAAFGLE